MLHATEVGDPSAQLGHAWIVTQELINLYARAHDRADAAQRHTASSSAAPAPVSPSSNDSPAPLDEWRTELLNAWTATGRRRVSTGPTDAINGLIKKVKRIPRGLPQLHQLLAPLLLAAGMDWTTVDWQGPPATPL